MSATAGRRLLIWLLAMATGALVVWHSRFVTDISFFLPTRPSPAQQVLVDQVRDSVLSRLLMVAIEGGDAPRRAAASRALRARLAALPEFASVQNGERGSLDADRDYLFRHRYLLSPTVAPDRFTAAGLRRAIDNSIDLLASPAGMMFKPDFTRDPTGEFLEVLSGLNADAQPPTREGVWMAHASGRALLLLEPKAPGTDTDGQQRAIDLVERSFEQIRRETGFADARLTLSGPGLFAVKSRATIQEEVGRLSLLTGVAIVLLLLYIYRSPRILLLGLLPVVSGALIGIVAVSLAFGHVFGITVGFGSALIGEAVDYSIYYFVQSAQLGVAAWRARFWPTVRLGTLTSIAGFGALAFSGFPGLAQLGLYSLAGLLTAALVTRFVLPALAGDNRLRDLSGLGRRLAGGIRFLAGRRWPVLLLATAAAAYLALQPNRIWQPDISALSTINAADSAADLALRADLGAPDSRYLVVIRAPDREAALQSAERVGTVLDRLIEQGTLGGYDSPARFLPSRARQALRRASLPSAEELAARLPPALADAPLAPEKLAGFVAEVERARHAPDLDRPALAGTHLALAVDALLQERPDGWQILLPLRPAGAGENGGIAAEPLRAAVAAVADNALFIDLKQEFDQLYASYLREAVILSLAGLAAILALLAFALRSPRRLATVMAPLLISVLLVIAALHLAGERLHLLHLIGMLLIVAIGSNYALFFDRRDLDPTTLISMLVANLTTGIGFGTLALSKVPMLHAVGITVGPGALLALLLSAVFIVRPSPPAPSAALAAIGEERGR